MLVWICCMLESKKLSCENTSHDQDEGGAQVAEKCALESYQNVRKYGRQSIERPKYTEMVSVSTLLYRDADMHIPEFLDGIEPPRYLGRSWCASIVQLFFDIASLGSCPARRGLMT